MTTTAKERNDASETAAATMASADRSAYPAAGSLDNEETGCSSGSSTRKKRSPKAKSSPSAKGAPSASKSASSAGKRSRKADGGKAAAAQQGACEIKRGVANKELGTRGEDAAVWYLKRRGYEIVARNWTCVAGEADIVALCDEAIVFVEVKTRSSTDMGMPEEAVGEKKRSRYEKIAALFLADYDIVDVQVRFDIISLVVIASNRALVRHHINAFGVA